MTDADALREGAAQERPPLPGSPAPTAAPAGDGKVMSLVDHLSELRNRLFKCLIVVGMPVLLYQLWAFIAPGLTTTERRTIRPWIPLALVFFAVGVGIAYFILPYAMGFLYSFATGTFE